MRVGTGLGMIELALHCFASAALPCSASARSKPRNAQPLPGWSARSSRYAASASGQRCERSIKLPSALREPAPSMGGALQRIAPGVGPAFDHGDLGLQPRVKNLQHGSRRVVAKDGLADKGRRLERCVPTSEVTASAIAWQPSRPQ